MINLPKLSPDQFRLALKILAEQGHALVPHPAQDKVAELMAVHEQLNRIVQPSEHVQVAVAVAHLLDLVHGMELLPDRRYCIDYAIILARLLMSESPYDFAPTPNSRVEITAVLSRRDDSTFVELLRIICNYCFDRPTARIFSDLVGVSPAAPGESNNGQVRSPKGPIRGFTAISMTDPTKDLSALIALSKQISETAGDLGIVCFQPIVEHSPLVSREGADDPALHAVDEQQISEADIVFIVADPPGSGLGAVNELARRYHAKRILMVTDSTVSPMLVGATPRPEIIPLGPDLRQSLRTTLQQQLPELEQRRDAREMRFLRAQEWLEQVVGELSRVDLEAIAAVGESIELDKERFRSLVTNARLIPGMTFSEQGVIESLTPRHARPQLPVDALRTMFMGEAQGWWPEYDTPRLLQAAMDAYFAIQETEDADTVIVSRDRWLQIPWWVELFDSLDE